MLNDLELRHAIQKARRQVSLRKKRERRAEELRIVGYEQMSDDTLRDVIHRIRVRNNRERKAEMLGIERYQELTDEDLMSVIRKTQQRKRVRAKFEHNAHEYNILNYHEMTNRQIGKAIREAQTQLRVQRQRRQRRQRRAQRRHERRQRRHHMQNLQEHAEQLWIVDYESMGDYQLFYEIQRVLLEQALLPKKSLILSAVEVNEPCSICLADLTDAVSTVCNHKFHKECIQEWAKVSDKCPMCRQLIKQ